MRIACHLGIALACLVLSGCDDVLVTTRLDPIRDDRVVGVWANPEDPNDLGIITRSGDGYAIRPREAGGKSTRFTLSRAGDVEFAQIEEKCANHVFSFQGDSRTCYLTLRLEFGANSLTFRQIGVDVFTKNPDLNAEYRIATSHPKRGDSVTCALIESPAPELLTFLASLPADSYKAGTRVLRIE